MGQLSISVGAGLYCLSEFSLQHQPNVRNAYPSPQDFPNFSTMLHSYV